MAANGECCEGASGTPAAPRTARTARAPRTAPLGEARRFAQRFYALGDGIRLEVLGLLRGGERCVCELTAHLALAQSRLSFHLKVLKDAGLISHRRQGDRKSTRLNSSHMSSSYAVFCLKKKKIEKPQASIASKRISIRSKSK